MEHFFLCARLEFHVCNANFQISLRVFMDGHVTVDAVFFITTLRQQKNPSFSCHPSLWEPFCRAQHGQAWCAFPVLSCLGLFECLRSVSSEHSPNLETFGSFRLFKQFCLGLPLPQTLLLLLLNFFWFFETGSGYVAQAGLKPVILLPWLPGITGMRLHIWPSLSASDLVTHVLCYVPRDRKAMTFSSLLWSYPLLLSGLLIYSVPIW